jgi:hypothetical protein
MMKIIAPSRQSGPAEEKWVSICYCDERFLLIY